MQLPPLLSPAPDLTAAERRRTARQARLPQLGEIGQRRIAAARVCVLGAGGLGAPALLYLAAAGVGTIGIVDDDVVEESNLHRQVVHGVTDLGRRKVDSAAERIRDLSPDTRVVVHPERLTEANAHEVLSGYDLVLDGTDNFETRYLVDDACAALGLPLVWGAVLRFDAQLSVFWARPTAPAGEAPPRGVRLRDLYPAPPAAGEVPSCAEAGVLGALCGQVGSIMAAEAIKLITGVGEPLLGRVLVIDALNARQTELPLRPAPAAAAVPTAQDAVSSATVAPAASAPRISATRLAERMLARGHGDDDFALLDVREPSEHAARAIPGARLLPLAELLRDPRATGLAPGTPLVVHCHGSERAERAARVLAGAGFADVAVLDGGIVAWDARG